MPDHEVDWEKWRRVSREHFSTIAPCYDTGRTFKTGLFWAKEIAGRVSLSEGDWLLDVGCGTGRCALAFAAELPGGVVGVDPALAMLAEATSKAVKRDGVRWAAGRAETLPFADHSFQVVFLAQVWHHLKDGLRAAAELYRLLKPGGSLFINTFSHVQIRARWDMTIFPELLPFMLSVYPDVPDFERMLSRIGFSDIAHTTYRKQNTQRPSALLEIVEGRLWSMFAYLSDTGRRAGMAHLRQLVAETNDAPIPNPTAQSLIEARK